MGVYELNISKDVIRFKECEWCYQFDGDEPRIFAWTEEGTDDIDDDPIVTFELTNIDGATITFTQNGKTFKLFARPLSDAGRELREFQNKSYEEMVGNNK
jgi:hypothetical protein